MAADEGVTVAEFRAARRMSAAKFAVLEKAGCGPHVTTHGRTRIITAADAQAWDLAESERLLGSVLYWADLLTEPKK